MKYLYHYKFTFIFSLFILYLLLAPSDSMPSVSFSIPHLDKWVHMGIFFVLTSIFRLEQFFSDTFSKMHYAVLALCLFALSTELLQGLLTSSRMADPLDFLANLIGILFAFVVFPLTLIIFNFILKKIKGMNRS